MLTSFLSSYSASMIAFCRNVLQIAEKVARRMIISVPMTRVLEELKCGLEPWILNLIAMKSFKPLSIFRIRLEIKVISPGKVLQALNEVLAQMKPDNRFAIIGYRGGPTYDSFPSNGRLTLSLIHI